MELPQAGPSRDSIPLYLINGVATIWDAQVAATLHCTHGVSGLRAGTLPGVSQQNAFLGLPMTLMQEETAYLVTSGICHLIPVSSTPAMPSAGEIEAHTQARLERIRVQEEARREAAASKAASSRAAFEQAGEKARLKREARAKAKAEKQATKGDTELFGDNAADAARPIPPAAKKEATKPRISTPAIESSVASPKGSQAGNPGWFQVTPAQPSFPQLSHLPSITKLPHPLFPFPSSIRDHALLGTFKELANRHYRVGLGPRFGGEYLIYPGDYLRYHAHFTSQVLVRDEPIKPTEIVAWGRLGTGTKKAGLICCWDDGERDEVQEGEEEKKGDVEFYSLEWANFG